MVLCGKLSDRLSEKSFVLFIQYPPDEGRPLATSSLARPLRGLTYSTLKFTRSTCGKSNSVTDVSVVSGQHDVSIQVTSVLMWQKNLSV